MNLRHLGLFAAALLSCANGAKAANEAETLAALARQDFRVASVGFRLAVANVDRCSTQMPATGLLLHSIAQYQGEWRKVAQDQFGEIDLVSIEGVVAQSPAAIADLRRGDAILAINGSVVATTPDAAAKPTAFRDRAENSLVTLPATMRIALSIRRDGATSEVALTPVAACLTRFEVVAGSGRFARSDGRLIQVGQALAADASDADLAVIVAHELAHSILGHRSRLVALEQAKDRSTRKKYDAMARQFESEADRLSVHLLAAAGFDPRSAPAFMRRSGKQFDGHVRKGSLHAKAEQRASEMDDEIALMTGAKSSP
ncbi:MAG: PDZ domain-containing protein [Novosphingobium sp.]